jgi:D-serine deaminase-like pyridoxal phosphate-dependent protein
MIAGLETPRLLLDGERFDRNCVRMRERCHVLGVMLRPHVKTAKSVAVARRALGGSVGPITVSTLKEADHFAAHGYRDILYATAIAPQKFQHAARIQREHGCDLTLVTDSLALVAQAAAFAKEQDITLSFLIEIDCGEHRSGVLANDEIVVDLARAISDCPHLGLRGVMAHAGHSYGTNIATSVRDIAAIERDAAVTAADTLRSAGLACDIVSVGSTPTVLHADHLDGITEVRAGIYMFWDLAQVSRGMCGLDDIAVSVLATVIGHNRHGGSVVLDAGALALSKDIGAGRFLPDAGYGYVCDLQTLARLGTLSVNAVHQEHGTVHVSDASWFDRLPVGSQVRILPNHACLTCAAYDAYDVIRDGAIVDRWSRINGW